MLKKLRNRLLFMNMIALSVVVIAVFAVIYAVTYSDAMNEVEQKVQRVPMFFTQDAQEVLSVFPDGITSNKTGGNPTNGPAPEGGSSAQTPSTLPLDFSPCFILFLDNGGELLRVRTYLDIPIEAYAAAISDIKKNGSSSGQINFEERHWQYAYATNDPLVSTSIFSIDGIGNPLEFVGRGIVQINLVDITETTDSLTRLLITFIIAGIVVLALLFCISLFFANRSIKPIEESWQKQKQFVTDASHELKTPLAIIGANLDALESDADATVGSQKKWTDYARHELGRMGKLINDLLYLAQSEDGRSDSLDFDLGKLIVETTTSMEAVLYEKNIYFSQSIQEGVLVHADEGKIGQALVILLDNAAKYTEEEGWILVSMSKDKGWAKVSVQNSGQGIAPQDLPNIFDRFYRPDQSRSTESGGYGLGLSIFRAIIERSGGRVSVRSADKVTEFSFTLKSEK